MTREVRTPAIPADIDGGWSAEAAPLAGARAARRARALELVSLFFLVPAALFVLRERGATVPTIPALLAAALAFGTLLWRDPAFDLRRAVRWRWNPVEGRRILAFFALGALLLTAYTALAEPARLLAFPRERPVRWALVLAAYPLLSVLPQELVYRVFFFHRYRDLIPSVSARVVASAFAFGFAHVVFGNWTSVWLSTLGGLLFSWTYTRRPSVWLVTFEHALYGGFVFTIGLGAYFWQGGTPG